MKMTERDILGYGGTVVFAVSVGVLVASFWCAMLVIGGVCVMRAVMKG